MAAQNLLMNGLTSDSVTLSEAGDYTVQGTLTLPTISGGGSQSAVIVTVNYNASPIYTGTAGATGFKVQQICAAGDVFQIVLSSANAADAGLNVIKATCQIFDGVQE